MNPTRPSPPTRKLSDPAGWLAYSRELAEWCSFLIEITDRARQSEGVDPASIKMLENELTAALLTLESIHRGGVSRAWRVRSTTGKAGAPHAGHITVPQQISLCADISKHSLDAEALLAGDERTFAFDAQFQARISLRLAARAVRVLVAANLHLVGADFRLQPPNLSDFWQLYIGLPGRPRARNRFGNYVAAPAPPPPA